MNKRLLYLSMALAVTTVSVGCFRLPFRKHNLPPEKMLMHPGPGVDGPGPGVRMHTAEPGIVGPKIGPERLHQSQLHFVGAGVTDGMIVAWDVAMHGAFDSEPLVVPGRQNFMQGAIYRLKLSQIPGHEGVELYPTIEIAPSSPRSRAFLSHNPIPFQLTTEDFNQILAGNFVTKVIYIPDPEFQEQAIAGPLTLVSTRLDPGEDPIVEADKRGSILAVIRVGNIDLEVPGDHNPEGQVEEILPAGYNAPPGAVQPAAHAMMTGQHAGPHMDPHAAPYMHPHGGGPMPMGPGYVSGVNMPQYGGPMSGTPIGLPGPPHLPLGKPAGLKSHTIRNWTHVKIPNPVKHFKIGVLQRPGTSYPKPVSRMWYSERAAGHKKGFWQPFWNKLQMVKQPYPDHGPHPHH